MSLEDILGNIPDDVIFRIIIPGVGSSATRRVRGVINLQEVCKKLYRIIRIISKRMSVICDYSYSGDFCTNCIGKGCTLINPIELGRMCYTRIFDFSYSNITSFHLLYLRCPEKVNLSCTMIDDLGLSFISTVKYLDITKCEMITGRTFKKLVNLEIIVISDNPSLEKSYYNALFLRGVKVWNYDQEW